MDVGGVRVRDLDPGSQGPTHQNSPDSIVGDAGVYGTLNPPTTRTPPPSPPHSRRTLVGCPSGGTRATPPLDPQGSPTQRRQKRPGHRLKGRPSQKTQSVFCVQNPQSSSESFASQVSEIKGYSCNYGCRPIVVGKRVCPRFVGTRRLRAESREGRREIGVTVPQSISTKSGTKTIKERHPRFRHQ